MTTDPLRVMRWMTYAAAPGAVLAVWQRPTSTVGECLGLLAVVGAVVVADFRLRRWGSGTGQR